MMSIYLKDFNCRCDLQKAITKICFEDPKMYRNFFSNISERIIISNNDGAINIKKKCLIISDPFNIELNDKKIITELYKLMKISMSDEQIKMLMEIESNMISLLEEVILAMDCNIDYGSDFDATKLFSLFQVCFKKVEYNNFLEFLIDYIKINIEIYDIDIVITNRLISILTEEEYQLLKKELILLECKVIDFEIKDNSINNDYLIDNDWCII